jgi:hypothetical protein
MGTRLHVTLSFSQREHVPGMLPGKHFLCASAQEVHCNFREDNHYISEN